ncbi:MAG: MipA/OmpV family protein [Bdellovibrio sp.]|nr:MipA/OmpV family protein [Bdellovibrio sp.]
MIRAIFLFFFLTLIWHNAIADHVDVPYKKFEWGVGLLSIYGHHYRGSDQAKSWFFPMPYFSYTSERIEAETSFIRGIFTRTKLFSFKLSLLLGLRVESENNRAREGMPSLDYTVEAGPMVIFYLWHSENKSLAVNLEIPVRESFATNLHYVRPVGLFTVPYINIIHTPIPSKWNWNSEFSVSPMFADQRFHQYYYGVDPQYVREDRPYYRARGGYSGFQTAIVMNKRVGNIAIIPFARWDYLKGAVFEDSPLVKVKNYAIAGLGIFWLF